jgi:hypothetical protein
VKLWIVLDLNDVLIDIFKEAESAQALVTDHNSEVSDWVDEYYVSEWELV